MNPIKPVTIDDSVPNPIMKAVQACNDLGTDYVLLVRGERGGSWWFYTDDCWAYGIMRKVTDAFDDANDSDDADDWKHKE